MAIQVEQWVSDIVENLFPNNEAVTHRMDDSMFLDGKVIHLPQSGAAPTVVVDRSSFPATSTQRTDTESSYQIKSFTTDPSHVTDTEDLEVSYPKRGSILIDHQEVLRTSVTEYAFNVWGASLATNIVRTSGAARNPYASAQTGQRLRLTKTEFIEAQRLLSRMDVPVAGRLMLVDADLAADLLSDTEMAKMLQNSPLNIVEGAIGRLYGFDIFIRSSVLKYNNVGTPAKKAFGAAAAATDNLAAIAWHPRFVRGAIGNATNGGVKIFTKDNDPNYYGSVLSAELRAGFKQRRDDGKGIVSLVEAVAS